MQSAQVSLTDPFAIRSAWQELKTTRKLRNRDAAEALGVSEAELVASVVGERATRLTGNLSELLKRVPELGAVMALTRNESCVHEKDGPYKDISINGQRGLVLGGEIDLRLFFSHWVHGYAVEEETPRGMQRSIQVYDAAGTAVHKIFLRPASDVEAFQRIVKAFTAANQAPGERVSPTPARVAPRPDADIDVTGLRQAWTHLKDTHEFFGLLKQYDVARTQAFRLAGSEFARRVSNDVTRRMLEAAAAERLPIMVFVGNRGCIQIHSGPVTNIKVMENWLNVLDPGFNLHLREDRIHESWVVRKPTTDGDVTSLEVFDADGETIVTFFGKRKPGVPELGAWRALLERIGSA